MCATFSRDWYDMPLLACGLNHKTAPLHIRERVAVTDNIHDHFLKAFVADNAVAEAAVLSTCNRTEWYCATENHEHLFAWLADYHQLGEQAFRQYCYSYHDDAAVRHMMRVACGLDSMVLGEPQILGQVKAAYQRARTCGTLGSQLEHLFQHVFAVTKKIRTDTELGVNPVSVAYAAIHLVVRRIYEDLNNLKVMLIGAGETSQLCARYLQECGCNNFIVANRNQQRAQIFLEQFNGCYCSIADIPEKIVDADIVISATASPLPILGKGLLERVLKQHKTRPMLLIDLAVPRDIEPEVAELANVFLYNIDDLQALVEHGLNKRRDAALQAEQIIEVELNHYLRWQRSLQAVETIRQYRVIMEKISADEYQKAVRALENGANTKDVLADYSRNLINKIMHQPSVRLRKAGYDGREDLLELANYLFSEQE